MRNPNSREDLSKFLVHLTRDYEGELATNNLLSILREKVIHARNAHCLFKYDFSRLCFSKVLSEEFQTVCFTEAPLAQIRSLVGEIPDRQIALKPYGLVFHKDTLHIKTLPRFWESFLVGERWKLRKRFFLLITRSNCFFLLFLEVLFLHVMLLLHFATPGVSSHLDPREMSNV